jgi:hypothetical protein
MPSDRYVSVTGLDAWHPSSGQDLSDWMDAGSHPA